MIYIGSDTNDGIPAKSTLASAEGAAGDLVVRRDGVRFSLSGHPTGFYYPSKGNESDQVETALAASPRETVRVLYDPHSLRGPIYSDRKHYTVFEVAVDGRPVRAYAQVAAGWRADNRIGFWGGCAMLLFSLAFGLHAWRSRRKR